MNELQIRISADIKQLQTAMNRTQQLIKNADNVLKQSSRSAFQLENSLAQLSNQFKAGAISEAQFNKQSALVSKELERQRANVRASEQEIKRLNSTLNNLRARPAISGTQRLGTNMSKLTGQVRGANGVAIEFSRIIQDAPFGLIGIGNNIQQLTQNYANLRRQTGSTSAALKASFSSLFTGSNLLVLGISAVTAGFTAYQMGAFDFLKSTKDSAKEVDKLNDDLDNFRKTLDGVASARIRGSADASKEIAELNALQKQAQKVSASMESRLSAVNQLQNTYPEYFGNLSQEAILTGDIGDANERLTKQLLGRAKAQAALNEIGERSLNILTLEERARERVSKLAELDLQRQQALASGQPATIATASGVVRTEAGERIQKIEGEINELVKEQVKDVDSLNKLKNKTIEQEEFINGLLGDGITLTDNKVSSVSRVVSETDKEVSLMEKLAALYAEISDNLDEIEKSGLLKGKEGIIDFGINLGDAPPVEDILPAGEERELLTKNQLDLLERAGIEIKNQTTLTDQQIESYKKLANELNTIDQLSSMLGDSLSRSFEAALFEGESFMESFQKAFTEMLKRLASQLLASAVLKILGTIVGGPAGGVISSGAGGLLFGGARANGGPVSSNKAYLVGEKGPEIFTPTMSGRIIPNTPSTPSIAATTGSLSNQTIDVNVYGQIMNDKIVLSNARGKRENGRFYGINN